MSRSALVTGASRGIGHAIALELAREGHALTVTARNAETLADVGDELCRAGSPRVVEFAGDMAVDDTWPALADCHRATFGDMSMLVLAAGVGTASGVEDATIRRTEKTFRVNYFARLRLIQLCLPQLREVALRRPKVGSRIVGLSSITGQFPEPKLAVYGSSKAALMSLLETVNAEESGRGVMATAIAPAYVATDMSAWVSDKIPIETMIPASDIATLVRMIARLDKRTSIPRLVVSRSGTASHEA